MNGRGRSIAVAAALAALVAVIPAGAAAKKKKNAMTATINGKVVKFSKRVLFSGGGGTVSFFVAGQTPIRHGLFKTLAAGCADLFPPPRFPSTPTACTSNYQETKIGKHPVFKFWAQPNIATQVTYDSYENGILVGRFTAVIPNTSPGDLPPVTVDAQFRGRFVPTQ